MKPEHYGKKVDVYFNLHKKTFSVRHKGKVIAHTDHIDLYDAQFVVGKKGRERVLREQKKNVHAVVRGVVRSTPPIGHDWEAVSYNPYKAAHFYRKDSGFPIYCCGSAHLIVKNKTPYVFAGELKIKKRG